jgi:CRP/FNR family transcriptional regulator
MQVYTTQQAADQLGVSRSTLLRWFRQGRVSGVGRDHNGWRRLSAQDLERIRRELAGPAVPRVQPANPRLLSYLRRVPVFEHLPQAVLDALAEEARFAGFLRGQTMFAPGDLSRGLCIVVKGRVRVYRISLEGREQVLRVAVPFQTLGESVLFRSGQRHTNYAVCLESSTTLILPLARLQVLMETFPVLAQAFLREFSQRLLELEERLEETALHSLERRVARLILEAESLSLPLRPRDLAAYLGAARESVSRVMLRLAREGLIVKADQGFQILDRAGLNLV